MDRLLLLIPATSYRVADFMAAAGRLGVELVVATDGGQALEGLAAGRVLALDFADPAGCVRRIAEHARDRPLSAVIGVDDATAPLAAMAAEALGLAHDPVDAVEAASDKYRLRTALANSGLPSPAFSLVPVDADPAEAAARAAYPCVLKPLALAGSRGVIRADDEAEFAEAFARIRAILAATARRGSAGAARHILVEDYIPGVEVALEGLLRDGRLDVLALFDKPDPLEGPYFEETIYLTPSRLDAAMQARIAEAVRRGARALGLGRGPVHAELRINARGVWIIELAARSIGGLCSRVLGFGAGMRLEELILIEALGRPLDAVERAGGAAGVMMIPIPAGGVLRAVGGLEAARAVPGIDDVRITVPLGRKLVPLPEGDRYLGFIFARGEDPDRAEDALRRAHASLSFEIAPDDAPAGSR